MLLRPQNSTGRRFDPDLAGVVGCNTAFSVLLSWDYTADRFF